MIKDYHNDGLIYAGGRAVYDCYLTAKHQLEKKCTRNKKTCRKSGCNYYLRAIDSCVGELDIDGKVLLENERCDDCIINNMPGLKKYCWKMKRRL